MEPESTDAGFEVLKYILLFGSMPLWVPFAKALWEEFQLALRADGGLAGRELSSRESETVEREIAATEEMSQVHEPIAHLRPGRGQAALGRRGPAAVQPGQGRGAGPQSGQLQRGFSRATTRPTTQGNRPRFR